MGKVEVNARGLSNTEVQAAIDNEVKWKNIDLKEAKKEAKALLIEHLSIDSMFALDAIEAIQQYHPEMLKDKIINKDAAIDLNDLEILEAE